MGEAPEIINYWQEIYSPEHAVEPTFQNFATLSEELESQVCCLYVVTENSGVKQEILVLVGQSQLDTINGFIGNVPKTSHIKAFEIFAARSRYDHICSIIGFYFDSVNGTYNSCVNGLINSFTDRLVAPNYTSSIQELVLPRIRSSPMAEQVAIRCNRMDVGKGKKKHRCKNRQIGYFYCHLHRATP